VKRARNPAQQERREREREQSVRECCARLQQPLNRLYALSCIMERKDIQALVWTISNAIDRMKLGDGYEDLRAANAIVEGASMRIRREREEAESAEREARWAANAAAQAPEPPPPGPAPVVDLAALRAQKAAVPS